MGTLPNHAVSFFAWILVFRALFFVSPDMWYVFICLLLLPCAVCGLLEGREARCLAPSCLLMSISSMWKVLDKYLRYDWACQAGEEHGAIASTLELTTWQARLGNNHALSLKGAVSQRERLSGRRDKADRLGKRGFRVGMGQGAKSAVCSGSRREFSMVFRMAWNKGRGQILGALEGPVPGWWVYAMTSHGRYPQRLDIHD